MKENNVGQPLPIDENVTTNGREDWKAVLADAYFIASAKHGILKFDLNSITVWYTEKGQNLIYKLERTGSLDADEINMSLVSCEDFGLLEHTAGADARFVFTEKGIFYAAFLFSKESVPLSGEGHPG